MPYETAEDLKARLEEAFGEDYPVRIDLDLGGFPMSLRFLSDQGELLEPPIGIMERQVRTQSAFDSFVSTMKAQYDRYRTKQT